MLSNVLDAISSEQSYSRTGRLLEAPAHLRNLASRPTNTKTNVDLSRLLSVADVQPHLQHRDNDELCSSARDHPSVALKNNYVATSEKRALFDASLKTILKEPVVFGSGSTPTAGDVSAISFIGAGEGGDAASKKGQAAAANPSAFPTTAALLGAHASAATASPAGSAAFRAVSRDQRARQLVDQPPPVGRYDPRYNVTEIPIVHDVSFTRAPRQMLKPATTPATEFWDRSGGSASKQDSSKAPSGPTWPFRSQSSGHSAAGKDRAPSRGSASTLSHLQHDLSTATHNTEITVKRAIVTCDMARTTGRTEPTRSVSCDIFYNAPLPKTHQPEVRMARVSGRRTESPIPRTAAGVARTQPALKLDNFEKFKFKKRLVNTYFDKYPSKDVWTNSAIATRLSHETGRSELPRDPPPLEPFKTRNIIFGKTLPRKPAQRSEGYGLQYEQSFAAMDLHVPGVDLARAPKKDVNPNPHVFEASQAVYTVDVNKHRRKLAHNVSFETMVSREGRERTGRGGHTEAHEISADRDPQSDALALPVTKRPVIRGDPRMATHVSREQRERVRNPPTDTNDLMYSYNADDFCSPLRKGAVRFEKMVSREEHSGSAFANSTKSMMRK